MQASRRIINTVTRDVYSRGVKDQARRASMQVTKFKKFKTTKAKDKSASIQIASSIKYGIPTNFNTCIILK